jgi:hypothetical protein
VNRNIRDISLIIDNPHVTRREVIALAHEGLRRTLKITQYELVSIELEESGDIETPNGFVTGKRFTVSYINDMEH